MDDGDPRTRERRRRDRRARERDRRVEAAEPRAPATLDEELLEAEAQLVLSTESDASRVERVRQELEAGFAALAGVGPAVSVYGSARTAPDDSNYLLARELARMLADAGFAVITGGGPGIMEAANRGARDGNGLSIGLGIDLPFEPGLNPYVDLPLQCHYFFTRKVLFVRYASSFVVFPGGFGTMDELFEALTLIQTSKIRRFPVVLVGRAYWAGLIAWVEERMLADGMISPGDIGLTHLTDDPAEILAIVQAAEHRQPREPSSQ